MLDHETKLQLDQVLKFQNAKETDQDRLIRTGHMTPFGTIVTSAHTSKDVPRRLKISNELTDFEKYLLDQAHLQQSKLKKNTSPNKISDQNLTNLESGHKNNKDLKKSVEKLASPLKSHRSSESVDNVSLPSTSKQCPLLSPKPKKKRKRKEDVGTLIEGVDDKKIRRKTSWPDPDANCMNLEDFENEKASGSEYCPSESNEDSSDDETKIKQRIIRNSKKVNKTLKTSINNCDEDDSSMGEKQHSGVCCKKVIDDGNQADYLKRLKWVDAFW